MVRPDSVLRLTATAVALDGPMVERPTSKPHIRGSSLANRENSADGRM